MMKSPSSSSNYEKASTITLNTEHVLDCPDLAVRLMHQKRNKEYWCSLITIDGENQGRDLMRKICNMRGGLPNTWSYVNTVVDVFLMQQECILVATVSELELLDNPKSDIEAQLSSQRIYVEHQERNEMLTEALFHPELLHSATRLVSNHLLSVISDPDQNGNQAIHMSKELSPRLAVAWFGIALLLSTGAGIVVGYTNQDVSFGLGLGFGVLGVLGPVQMILAWYASMR